MKAIHLPLAISVMHCPGHSHETPYLLETMLLIVHLGLPLFSLSKMYKVYLHHNLAQLFFHSKISMPVTLQRNCILMLLPLQYLQDLGLTV